LASGKRPPLSLLSERLGYAFNDVELLKQALTHGSKSVRGKTYERLEFLGDRVLSLVIADALLGKHRKEQEGKLSARHSALVRGEACAAVGEDLGLADFIVVGEIEKRSGVHRTRTVLGDAVEALIGAIYLDGGLEPARAMILRYWTPYINKPDTAAKDAKTFIQEWALAKALPLPRYGLVKRDGPEHKPRFMVEVLIDKHTPALGEGLSKQAAEMAAAASFIAREGLR
jgi:ribonuclease III